MTFAAVSNSRRLRICSPRNAAELVQCGTRSDGQNRAAFGGDDGGPLVDVDAARDQAAARISALALVVFFAVVPQVKIQVAPVFLVFPDMPIDGLVTDRDDAFLRQATGDLFGAPLLLRN